MKRYLLTVIALLTVSTLFSQHFDAVVDRNLWNSGYNRAGLRVDTLSCSYAEVWGGIERGALTNHSQSDRSFTAGVKSESIRHFGRISFMGALSFDYFDGKNMWGSMFMEPGSWLVDIYEYTPGRKVRENYSFTGALSYEINPKWQVGILADFTASNYAKRKDLRHKNTALDLKFAPSVRWSGAEWSVGAAYIFQKRSESIKAEEIGVTPDSYHAFFDSGMFYGKESPWTSSDIHLDIAGVDNFPISEQQHGVELKLGWRELLLSGEYHFMQGETGEKGVVWHNFDADRWALNIAWQQRAERALHTLRLAMQHSIAHNNEMVIRTETEGGVSNSKSYGEVPIYTEIVSSASLEYDLQINKSRLQASVEYLNEEKQSSLLYPYLKEQELSRWLFRVDGVWSLRCVDIMGGVNFTFGESNYSERVVAESLPSSGYPERQSRLSEWYDEYMTSPMVGLNLGIRVNLPKGFYIEPYALYRHGFNLVAVPQSNRVEATLRVGCCW